MKRDKDLPSQPGVYLIISPDNQKGYAGSTSDLRRRANRHARELREGIHYNQELQQLYYKYKEELEFIGLPLQTKDQALDFEQEIIDTYVQSGLLCNKAMDARDSGKGFKLSDEHKAKLISSNIGKHKSPEHRAAISRTLTGRKLSEENAAKARIAAIGYIATEELRLQRSLAMKGVPKTEDAKEKMRLAKADIVQIDGNSYFGLRHAAQETGVSSSTVKRRIESPRYPNWKKFE